VPSTAVVGDGRSAGAEVVGAEEFAVAYSDGIQ